MKTMYLLIVFLIVFVKLATENKHFGVINIIKKNIVYILTNCYYFLNRMVGFKSSSDVYLLISLTINQRNYLYLPIHIFLLILPKKAELSCQCQRFEELLLDRDRILLVINNMYVIVELSWHQFLETHEITHITLKQFTLYGKNRRSKR